MKQYLLAVYSDESAQFSDAELQAMDQAVDAFNGELQASGAWVFACGLYPHSDATVVRAQGGKVVTTDGPFAETRSRSAASG